jgi:hypothetical protein
MLLPASGPTPSASLPEQAPKVRIREILSPRDRAHGPLLLFDMVSFLCQTAGSRPWLQIPKDVYNDISSIKGDYDEGSHSVMKARARRVYDHDLLRRSREWG